MDASPLYDTKVLFLFLEVIRKIIKRLRKTFYDENEWPIFMDLKVSSFFQDGCQDFLSRIVEMKCTITKPKGGLQRKNYHVAEKDANQGEADKQ